MFTQKTNELKIKIHQNKQNIIEKYQKRKIRSDTLLKRLSKHMDQTLAEIAEHISLPKSICICAVGGYGRGELFPYSDVDLLFLYETELSTKEQEFISNYVTLLWDLGIEVGHSVRSIEECLLEALDDITIETNLLEIRHLFGDYYISEKLTQAFRKQLDPAQFFLSKLLELQQRYSRYNFTPYALEPNCKESPGALRDIHLIQWFCLAIGLQPNWNELIKLGFMTNNEAKLMKKADRGFKRLRIELHLLANKREDRILFDLQPLLAEKYRFKPQAVKRASEVFMQIYYRSAKTVYLILRFIILNLQDYLFVKNEKTQIIDEDFIKVGQLLDIRKVDAFKRKPQLLLKAFLLLQQNQDLNDFTVRTQRAIWNARYRIDNQFRKNPINNKLFLDIFKEPTGIVRNLRRMSFLEVLPNYIPSFKKIVGQMQHDLYHVYTVDQHTLMVIRNLRRFTLGEYINDHPLANKLAEEFKDYWLLYIAALFHDIAKGRGGDHSELGAVDVKQFAIRHNLQEDEIELLEFLVLKHLEMSTTAQKRDLSDPDVIQQFCDTVKTPYRLTALYLLTVADIKGTNPKIWNAWKAKLLDNLYHLSLVVLGGVQLDEQMLLTQRQQNALKLLENSLLTDEQKQKFWSKMDVAYFLRHEPNDIKWHTELLYEQMDTTEAIVKARVLDNNEGVQVLVFTQDHPYLFETISSFFFEKQIEIYEAQIHTNSDGYVLDSFIIDATRFSDQLKSFSRSIELKLSAYLNQSESNNNKKTKKQKYIISTPSYRRAITFPITPRLMLESDEEQKIWRLNITTTDSPGLLYHLAQLFRKYNINLQMAKILTLGERVEDVFILEGTSLNNPRTQLTFKREVLNTLTQLLPMHLNHEK